MKIRDNILVWIYFLLLVLIWGSSFILIKNGLKSYSPWEAATIRLVSACSVFIFLSFRHLKKIPTKKIPIVLFLGVLNMFVPAYLFCMAQTHITSGMAGILNSLTPLFTSIIAIVFFGKLITRIQWLGLVIGFCSTAFLILMNTSSTISLNEYALLIIVATICYGASINIVKNHLASLNSLHITTVAVSFAGILGVVVLISGGYKSYFTVNEQNFYPLLSLITLGIVGTAIAQLIQNQLIKKSSAVFASSMTYVIPIVAVLWGLLDGEQLYYYHFLGMMGIITGILIINKGGSLKKSIKKETVVLN